MGVLDSTASASPTEDTTTTGQNQTLLAVVVSIGGIIITASIIIIVVVAVFVRKSTRELKQQTRTNQNRPHGQRPAHANSVRVAQGQRAEAIRGQSEAQGNTGQDPNDTEKAQGVPVPDEIQGFYAHIPRADDLGSSGEGQADTCGQGILYAALEFDDVTGKPGKLSSEETGTRLTGPSVVVPSSQPDTYVEMEPLVASIKIDSAPVECYPTGGIYDLARDPDAEASTRGFPPDQTNPGLYQNLPAGDKGNETLLQTDM